MARRRKSARKNGPQTRMTVALAAAGVAALAYLLLRKTSLFDKEKAVFAKVSPEYTSFSTKHGTSVVFMPGLEGAVFDKPIETLDESVLERADPPGNVNGFYAAKKGSTQITYSYSLGATKVQSTMIVTVL